MLVVAAKGNDNTNNFHYPSDFPFVMAVGATDQSDNRASFSNYGSALDVVAPGDYYANYSTKRGNQYDYFQGTSCAAPMVSGAAGLVISEALDRGLNLSNDDVQHLLEGTATKVSGMQGNNWTQYYGYGRINVGEALRRLNLPYEISKNSVVSTNATLVENSHQHEFYNNGGLATGAYYGVKTYKITTHVTYSSPYTDIPLVWSREKNSSGWSYANPNNEWSWANITNVTNTGFDIETVVYWIGYNSIGQSINQYYPGASSSLQGTFAYTVIGRQEINQPTTLVASALSSSQIRLSWQDNSNNEYAFDIKRSIDGINFSKVGELVTDGNGSGVRTFDDNGLQQNVTYYYRINGYAQEFTSSYSNTASEFIPTLQAVTNLLAEGQPMHVKLSWSGVPNAEGYRIYRNGSPKGTTWETTFWDAVPNYIDTYNYEVRSYYKAIEMPGPSISGKAIHLASLTSTVTGPNNQRKIMYDDAGAYHMVYESGGEIWYTKSTDNGQNWTNEVKISNRVQFEYDSKNPSLYCYTANNITYVQVAWIQGFCINYKEYTSNSGWGSIYSLCEFYGGGPPSLLPSIANPVVYNGYIAFEYPKDAAGTTTAIAIARWTGNEWIYTTDMPGVSTQVKRPAIVYASYKLHLVCQDAGSIKYNAVLLNNNTLQWAYTTSNISDGSNRTSNSATSITFQGSYLFTAWEGLNGTNGKKEIIIRKKALSGSWLSFDYIGSDATCNSGVNFYAPSINQVSSTQVGLVWQDVNGASWASRNSENDGVWYKYKLVESNSMNPTLSNNATGDGKVMYTQSSASAPYALKFSSIPSGTPQPTLYAPPNNQEGMGLGIWLGWYCVYGATSYRVQVSTEFANFESGIIKDQSGITATSYQPGGLTYSTTYYWRVSAKLFNVIDGDWSDIWSFRTMDYSPPGCPYVFSKIGNDFIIDNNILPQSEYSGNKNKVVTDYYKLLATPTSDNGKYTIEVREFERELSQFDEIKLLAVDHNLNTDIAVLPNGEIIEYLPAFRLTPDESKDNFEKLSTLEGKAYITDRNDEFLLHFEPVLEGFSPDDLSTMEGGLLLGGWIVRGDKHNLAPDFRTERKASILQKRRSPKWKQNKSEEEDLISNLR